MLEQINLFILLREISASLIYKLKYIGDNALPCGNPFNVFISLPFIIIVNDSYISINVIKKPSELPGFFFVKFLCQLFFFFVDFVADFYGVVGVAV